MSSRPQPDHELARELEAALRDSDHDEVVVSVSGQYVHVERIIDEGGALAIKRVLDALGMITSIEARTEDYRVLGKMNVRTFIDPRYADRQGREIERGDL